MLEVGLNHLFLDLQDRQERILGYFDTSHLFHAFFTGFLLLKQLFLTRDITAITLGSHIFTQCLDIGSRQNLPPDRGLNSDVKHLSRNEFLHFTGERHPFTAGIIPVHDYR